MPGPHHPEEGEGFAVGTLSFTRENILGSTQPRNPGYCVVKQGVTAPELTD